MPIGAISISGRMSAAFAYLATFFGFIILWVVIAYGIEFFFNVFVTAAVNAVFPAVSVPTLNIPDPLELLSMAIDYFQDLFGIGGSIFWGFIETLAFGAMIIFGIPGALMGPGSPFNRIKDFLQEVHTQARDKYK